MVKKKSKKNTKSKAAVIDEEDEEDELGKTPLTVAGEATEYYLQSSWEKIGPHQFMHILDWPQT